MRNVMKILAAGALVGCLSVGLAHAGDRAIAVPTFTIKILQKAVAPGSTVTAEVRLHKVTDLGAFQFMMKTSGGERGSVTVENIVIDKQRQDFVFGTAQAFSAVDHSQMRAGGVLVDGGRDIVDSAYLATVTFRVSDDAAGTFQLNVDKGRETFLRNSSAVAIAEAIGPAATITVADRATPTRVDKRKGR